MMICQSDIVDRGQGLAHGEEVDVFVRQTELPSVSSAVRLADGIVTPPDQVAEFRLALAV